MKIGITARGPTIDSPCEERFGRAPYFIIYDTDSGDTAAIQNELADAPGGVGPRVAQLMHTNGVEAVISGRVGGNAERALAAAGIAMYAYDGGGTVGDAIAAFRRGELMRIV
ncbi:MAG: NifB/NifX family molybdenum-iron cluster-binding protein [Methanomicrobiaceae archaeon]|nr:NifB/NifX family molybdenum-iron cluster-binding protein [Methanomicrobiaceae archaeon]